MDFCVVLWSISVSLAFMKPEEALSYWRQALDLEFGLALPIPGGPPALRKAQKLLYDSRKAQRELGVTDLEKLMMVMPNGGREIWLIKKEVELDEV